MEVKRFDNFKVHFEWEIPTLSIAFVVYPVTDWTGLNGTSGTSYETEENGRIDMLDDFDEKRARRRLSGIVIWRGCWEERLYFVDEDEYWGHELKEMHDLFFGSILPYCRDEIKKAHTDYEITDD